MSMPAPATGQATPTEAILESISDGVFTVDANWRITSFNRAAETITGISRKTGHRTALLGCIPLEHVRSGVPPCPDVEEQKTDYR